MGFGTARVVSKSEAGKSLRLSKDPSSCATSELMKTDLGTSLLPVPRFLRHSNHHCSQSAAHYPEMQHKHQSTSVSLQGTQEFIWSQVGTEL